MTTTEENEDFIWVADENQCRRTFDIVEQYETSAGSIGLPITTPSFEDVEATDCCDEGISLACDSLGIPRPQMPISTSCGDIMQDEPMEGFERTQLDYHN